jgi:hypothetical protein
MFGPRESGNHVPRAAFDPSYQKMNLHRLTLLIANYEDFCIFRDTIVDFLEKAVF